ncbi:MAG: glycosyltransferase family 2 protein [Zestosphaera sp.]
MLVTLLNKDNANGLKKALETLSTQESVELCSDFDVLVMDGWSTDSSEDVVREFASRFECVKFIRQRFPGGVGQARIEAVRHALDASYDIIIWGDSENIYGKTYISEILKCINSARECSICSGSTYVRDGLWGKLFYWYHAYHHLFKLVSKRHAPGNNKAVRSEVYKTHIYPATSRSDDFFFSLSIRNDVTICHCKEASLTTALPTSFRGVLVWQRGRVRGLVEGSLLLGRRLPPDFPPWFLFMISPFILTTLYLTRSLGPVHALSILPEALITAFTVGVAYMVLKLELLARERFSGYRPMQGLLGFIGMYLHAVFTTYYSLKYFLKLRGHVDEIRGRDAEVKKYFGFSNNPTETRLQDPPPCFKI